MFAPVNGETLRQRDIFGVGREGFPLLPLSLIILNRNTRASYCGFDTVIDVVVKAPGLLTPGTAASGRSGLSYIHPPRPVFEYGNNGNKTQDVAQRKCAKAWERLPEGKPNFPRCFNSFL